MNGMTGIAEGFLLSVYTTYCHGYNFIIAY